MNYQKIYWDIINRAIDRTIEGYTERHHAYPACLCRYSKRFGERDVYLFDRNADDLIVELTAREHYVAHQLLAKMYPTEPGLQLAVHMMTVSDSVQVRNNRSYEWVRRRHAKAMSELQAGKRNSQYGRRFKWMYHPDDLRTAKVPIDQVDKFINAGYEFGLKPNVPRHPRRSISTKKSIKKYKIPERKKYVRIPKSGKTKSQLKEEGRKLSVSRFMEFMEGDFNSIRQYSKYIGISAVALSNGFKKHIPGYARLEVARTQNIKQLLTPIYENLTS